MRDDFDVPPASSTCAAHESSFSIGRSVSPFNMSDESPAATHSENPTPVESQPRRGGRPAQPPVSTTVLCASVGSQTRPNQDSHQRTLKKDRLKEGAGRPRRREKDLHVHYESRGGQEPPTPLSSTLGNTLGSNGESVAPSPINDGAGRHVLQNQLDSSVSLQRKRGRPSKTKESNSSSNERRSPRKPLPVDRLGMADREFYYLEDEEDYVEQEQPRQRRGLPPKSRTHDPVVECTSSDVKSTRGRPRRKFSPAKSPIQLPISKDAASLSNARRSGRKRQRTDRLGMADDADYYLEAEEEISAEEEPKPGRPTNGLTQNQPLEPRRRRGRPPKSRPASALVTNSPIAGTDTKLGVAVAGADHAQRKRGPPPKNRDIVTLAAASTNKSASIVANFCQASHRKDWTNLKHAGLVSDYTYGKFIPMTFGSTLESTIAAVEDGLDEIGDNAEHLPDCDPYIVEAKMYQRSMKERQQRSDGERIEKLRHREEYENRLREFQYNSRGRKRTPYEAELDEICVKPIEFTDATRESARTMKCRGGPDCKLCGPTTSPPTFSEEQEKASRRVPAFRLSRISDSWVETRLEDEEVELTKKQSRSRRRQARHGSRTQNTIDILTEMKYSLDFVKRYNEGYL